MVSQVKKGFLVKLILQHKEHIINRMLVVKSQFTVGQVFNIVHNKLP